MPLRKGAVTETETAEETKPPFDHNEDVVAELDSAPAAPTGQEVAQVNPTEIGPVAGAPLFTPGEDPDFEDDDVDRWSFPNIKLDEGQFMADEEEIGKEFDCVVLKSTAKWVMKNARADKADEISIFTYDRITDANTGEYLKDVIEDWKASGWGVEWRQYSEKQAVLLKPGHDLDRAMVIVNIPPTSRTVYNGANKNFRVQHGAKRPRDYVIRCKVGRKAGAGKTTWLKWAFEYVRTSTPEDIGEA
jgi:hypothetical protein